MATSAPPELHLECVRAGRSTRGRLSLPRILLDAHTAFGKTISYNHRDGVEHKNHRLEPRMKIALNVFATTVLLLSTRVPVHAADTSPRRALTPDDFYNMQVVSEPQVAPDGKWVA